MDSNRWREITEIFEAAVDKPQIERDSFVRKACEGDGELEAAVIRLLEADAAAGRYLESPPLRKFRIPSSAGRSSLALSCGTLVSGRFEIVRLIGQGGMGQVYEAVDRELNEHVALKAIRPDISSDPSVLARFRREVQLTRRITHRNVCRTFDIERHCPSTDKPEENFIFLTMELLKGETLAELLRRERKLDCDRILPLVQQMVEALQAAHNVRVIHRDFKPSNILIVPSGSGERLVVTDFGLAHAFKPGGDISEQVPSSMSGLGGLAGTLVYMSPEQLDGGKVAPASDIYSLGLVMYEMVTGARPFADADPFAEALKRIKRPAPSARMLVPQLGEDWEKAIRRCLEVEPQARFDSVSEVAESISGVETRQPPKKTSSNRPAASLLKNARRRSFGRAVAIAAICFAVMALFVVILRQYITRTEPPLARGSKVLLTQVRNSTGDSRFDGTTELLRNQLSQSPYFNLLDSTQVTNLLARMRKAPDPPADPATERELALRGGASRVIYGGVSRVGDDYGLEISIEKPDNNPRRPRAHWENHWTWRMGNQRSGQDIPSGFLGAVRDAGDWIRSQAGESGSDIASVNAPPEDVTTGSWNALSEFVQAEKFKTGGQTENAIVALRNAVAEDPEFALAYMRLGDLLLSINRYDEGYQAYQMALSDADRVRLTRRERDRLRGIYAHDREDFGAAETAFQDYTVYYPDDYAGWFYRAYPLMMLARPAEAIASLRKAAAIDPERMFAPAHIARFNLIAENFEESAQWTHHLRETGHIDDANLIDGESDFLQGRYADSRVEFKALQNSVDSTYQSYGYAFLVRLFAELGQYKNAFEVLQQGITADLESGDKAGRADKLLDRAYLNLKVKQYNGCLQDLKSALALDRSLQRSLIAGTIASRAEMESAGTTKSELHSLLLEIAKSLPAGSVEPLSAIVRARLHGEVLLADGQWKQALGEFKRARDLEAPVKDREYLARASLVTARHLSGQPAAELIRESHNYYGSLVTKPGQIWQWALDYPPGYLSDETLSFLETSSNGMIDVHGKALLGEVLKRRSEADDVAGLDELKKMGTRSVSVQPN